MDARRVRTAEAGGAGRVWLIRLFMFIAGQGLKETWLELAARRHRAETFRRMLVPVDLPGDSSEK